MKIKFEIDGKEYIRDIQNEVLEKELETQEIIIKEKEENENALTEVNNAFEIIQEELNKLRKNINTINQRIQENQVKLRKIKKNIDTTVKEILIHEPRDVVLRIERLYDLIIESRDTYEISILKEEISILKEEIDKLNKKI